MGADIGVVALDFIGGDLLPRPSGERGSHEGHPVRAVTLFRVLQRREQDTGGGIPAQVMRLGDIGAKAKLGMEKAEQEQALEQRLPLHRVRGTGGGGAAWCAGGWHGFRRFLRASVS